MNNAIKSINDQVIISDEFIKFTADNGLNDLLTEHNLKSMTIILVVYCRTHGFDQKIIDLNEGVPITDFNMIPGIIRKHVLQVKHRRKTKE